MCAYHLFRLAELTCESHEICLPPWSEGQRLAPGWPGAFLVRKVVPEGVSSNGRNGLVPGWLGAALERKIVARGPGPLDENCVVFMHWSIPEVGRHIEQGRGGRVTKKDRARLENTCK